MFETAYEYLIDYANNKKCDEWVAKVIKTFLHGDADNYIGGLANDLLGIAEYTLADKTVRTVDVSNDEVYLKELIHHSGVNALADEQMIRFTPQVNIIYGLNGTGKSSYFRILNEMIGGKNKTPIRPNIYRDDAEAVSVDVKYVRDGVEKPIISWNGSSRGLKEFRSLRVFDSAYTRDLLKKRDSDELVVKPYGLNVFSDIILYIDKIIDKANEIIKQKDENVSEIKFEDISEETANLFKKEYTEDDELKIRAILDAEIVTEKKLCEKESEISDLKIGNPKEKIIILNDKKEHAENTKQFLIKAVAKANEYVKLVKQNIILFNEQNSKCEEFRKKIEILQNIPGTDTKLWKEFVSKGIEYKRVYSMKVCPFCHQTYVKDANEIVKAYMIFLDDKTQADLKATEDTLGSLLKEIEGWKVIWKLEEDKWPDKLRNEIEKAIDNIANVSENCIKCIENKVIESISQNIDLKSLIEQIEAYCDDIQEKINALSKEKDGKTIALRQAEIVLSNMKTVFAVQSQKNEIENFFKIKKWVAEKNKCISELSSQKQKISTLSKKAHNELLTQQLQSTFIDNLKKLNVRNIEIELLGRNNKGMQQTELTIKKNKDITTILSEGEQKATALALFLAEISLSHNKSTIIFDDPVNSLDHRMMQALSDLLMNVENQIIVFTHSKMFLDCFECTEFGHICKGLDSACNKKKGKHIYLYETNSEGKNRKGVIVEKRVQNLQYYLDELKKMLGESPFTKCDEAAIMLRRGVETAIDEIIFNRQAPTKLSNKNSRIQWEELKGLSNEAKLIDGLKKIHGRASGGDLHNGSERENNPLDRDEIVELYDKLKKLCHCE